MEVSRNLLAVLLLLVIVLSGFGTWSLLSRDAQAPSTGGSYTAPDGNGQVSLTIADASDTRGRGVVTLDIKPGEVTNG